MGCTSSFHTLITGNLPHLTYIENKPVDFGVEFKVLMCSAIGCYLRLELMEGQLDMAVKRHNRRMGATAGLCVCMHEEW